MWSGERMGTSREPCERACRAGTRAVKVGRILVVDDHLGSRVAVSLAFRQLGYECEHVGIPADALVAIESFRPEAVLFEWSLRDGSGLGLARRFRLLSLQLGRPLRVIVLSTQAEPGGFRDREEVDDYVVKPARAAELACRIRSLCNDHGGADHG